MKNIYLLIFCLMFSVSALAQQLPQFTQYMYNTISINPAYAGSRDGFSITALNRNQWAGVSGAPNTQTLSVHSPLTNDKVGLGLSVINDKTGYENYTYAYGDFAYRLDFNNNISLAMGLKAGMSYYNLDEELFNDQQVLNDPFFEDQFNKWTPNFGIGFYLSAQNWYIGASAPKLINNNNHEYNEFLAMEQIHYYLTGGYVFDLNENLKFRPTSLLKMTSGAPLSVDFSGTMIFHEKFYLGANWRIDDALGAFLDVELFDGFRAGYAYEYSISDIRPYTSGSHEILLIYEFRFQKTRYKSPRFF
ncbi:PorP/SprF family type IX secretion system membrane protein [Salegentibacter salegens]|uniref:Type IX secretion system membrane protein, PorP/SprF family n=1 Tax=Salegentibacter salegens TaxID=143223 RepID=A0A1M7JKA9_9FLAO|nr:type IX secretion system membrane protein PorP/SprF [Salegentibacter salegens]PRX51835.1 type IX secretion system PorP/SprF family membrane protein [Salegentibacter salegens]SHM53428.1 type IX secretion system membrane protein, PorP/SprF family [Salegentibacter salegens]